MCSSCQVMLNGRFAISPGDLLIFYYVSLGYPEACCISCASNINYQTGNEGTKTIITLSDCTYIGEVYLGKVLPQGFRLLDVTPLGDYSDQIVNNLGKLGIPVSNLPCAQASAVRTGLPASTSLDCELLVMRYLISSGYEVCRIPEGHQAGFDMVAWWSRSKRDEVYLIEVKSGTSDLSPTQVDLMREVRSNPCNVHDYLCGQYGVIRGLCQQYNLLTRCPFKNLLQGIQMLQWAGGAGW